jgi:hypothetical protein
MPWPRGLSLVSILSAAIVLGSPRSARAWSEYEHVKISASAIHELAKDATTRKRLANAWRTAKGASAKNHVLCDDLEATYGPCVALADLPMLAADHACSPGDLAATLDTKWVAGVLEAVAEAQLAVDRFPLAQLSSRDDQRGRLAVRHDLNATLETIDPLYLTRATGNIGHFTLPSAPSRPRDELRTPKVLLPIETPESYLERALTRGPSVQMNASALYAAYHTTALRYALGARSATADDRPQVIYWALLTETFALHYLEDAFSAGHIVGVSEDSADRLGTHDAYCQQGLDVKTWDQTATWTAYGDGFLTLHDESNAAFAVSESLKNVLSALEGELPQRDIDALSRVPSFAALDTCSSPDVLPSMAKLASLTSQTGPLHALWLTPRPVPARPSVLRVRSEVGTFVAFNIAADGGPGGFIGGDSNGAFLYSAGARMGLGLGYASDGVVGPDQDGLAYVTLLASADTDSFKTASVGPGIGLRLPFAYMPGDFLIWFPASLAGSAWGRELAKRAIAGDHTVFGVQTAVYIGNISRLELDLGREVSFGWQLATCATCVGDTKLRYAKWDATIPIATFRVGHSFSNSLANDLSIGGALRVGNAFLPIGDDQRRGVYMGGVLTLTNNARLYLGSSEPKTEYDQRNAVAPEEAP